MVGGLVLTRAVAETPAWELYTDCPAALSWPPSLGVCFFPFKSGDVELITPFLYLYMDF